MECQVADNSKHCNCTYPCNNKGVCCDCIAYHRNKGQLPACYFPADYEKTYDRSINNYLKSKGLK
ncbi:MAG: hypothetical protein CVU05_03640 [Bacteroidetes bacterium HGW-Bacteroidetes-21]|nr:MAG: hypothetical protein CVU05_03640 [Bacteroidetes bacterium HGW-Bacteroidetes-21]